MIVRGIVIGEAGAVEKDTKTHQVRRLSLDSRTLANLRSHRQRGEGPCTDVCTNLDPDSYIFSGAADGAVPWHPNSISRAFRNLADAARATTVRLPDLRHYVATELLSNGVDVRTVAADLATRTQARPSTFTATSCPEADQKAASVPGDLLAAAAAERESAIEAEDTRINASEVGDSNDETASTPRYAKRGKG